MTRGEYDRSNDDKTYVVTRPNGTLITVTGIHSARAVAGKDGSYEEEK
jgi:hypothetical protein